MVEHQLRTQGRWPGTLFWYFSDKNSHPIQGNKHFYFSLRLSHNFLFFFFGSSILQFDDSTGSPAHAQQWEEHEIMAGTDMSLATHASSMRHKLWEMLNKAVKTPITLFIKAFKCLKKVMGYRSLTTLLKMYLVM